jgi:amino-acid N-acetyltransferase
MTAFLQANALPTVGLEDWYRNFFIASNETNDWVGIAGYELYNQSALLRSVAVDERARDRGHGRALVDATITDAKTRGVRTIYLLTETAEAYFKRLGFLPVNRADVDQTVRNSAEFNSACCSGCQAMQKTI